MIHHQLTRLCDQEDSERRIGDERHGEVIRPIFSLPERHHANEVLDVERGVEP